jgi:hypothetical protein
MKTNNPTMETKTKNTNGITLYRGCDNDKPHRWLILGFIKVEVMHIVKASAISALFFGIACWGSALG